MTNNLATDQRQSWRWLQAWQSPVNIQSDRTPSSSDTCDGHTDPWTISTSSSSHRFLPPSASRCSWKPTCTLTTYHKWSCPVPFLLKPEHQSAQMSKITNPVWHRMLYSCTHNMATVGVRGLKSLVVPTQSTGIIDTAGRCRHMPFQQAFFSGKPNIVNQSYFLLPIVLDLYILQQTRSFQPYHIVFSDSPSLIYNCHL